MLKIPLGNSIRRLPKLSQLTAPVPTRVARLVLSSRLICATDEPTITGSISLTMRRTRGSLPPQCAASASRRRRAGVQPRQLEQELQNAGGKHRISQHVDRARVRIRHDEGRADDAQVKDHRGERRHGELAVHIQHAAHHRGQRYEHQIREGPAQQAGAERRLRRIVLEPRRQHPHQQRRRHAADHRDDRQHPAQRAHHHRRQIAHILVWLMGLGFGKYRDESLRECPLGEHAPAQVGNQLSHHEGVKHGAAECRRQGHVTDQAKNAGQQGQRADDAGGFEQGLGHSP